MTATTTPTNPLAALMADRGLSDAEVERLTDRLEHFPRVGRETIRKMRSSSSETWNPEHAAAVAAALEADFAPDVLRDVLAAYEQRERKLRLILGGGAGGGSRKRGNSTRSNRSGPGRNRLGGTRPGGASPVLPMVSGL